MRTDPGGSISRELVIVTTGGTIDKVYNLRGELEVGEPAAGAILDDAGVENYRIVRLFKKDSLAMTSNDRAVLADAIDQLPETAVVVVHGTDTMVETARWLATRWLEGGRTARGRTVVLTGAIQPAAVVHSDAAFNLGCAVAAARTLSPGVYLAMNGQTFSPGDVRKDRRSGRFLDDATHHE